MSLFRSAHSQHAVHTPAPTASGLTVTSNWIWDCQWLHLFQDRTFECNWHRFWRARCPSCHTNSDEALNPARENDQLSFPIAVGSHDICFRGNRATLPIISMGFPQILQFLSPRRTLHQSLTQCQLQKLMSCHPRTCNRWWSLLA